MRAPHSLAKHLIERKAHRPPRSSCRFLALRRSGETTSPADCPSHLPVAADMLDMHGDKPFEGKVAAQVPVAFARPAQTVENTTSNGSDAAAGA